MTDTDTPDREPLGWLTPPSAINDAARAMMLSDAVRYSSTVTVRCQPEITAAVSRAARAKGTRPAEYVRQSLMVSLRLDGFEPATVAPRDAGALYDLVQGRQRYAMIEDGKIVFLSYHDAKPEQEGRVWVPVVHEDSEPFDLDRHWRLAPVTRIEADRVVVTYPVVLQAGGQA